MGLILKIISGPLSGKKFPLKAGLTVGRAGSDITISDPKMSGRHAKIENNADDNLVITDLGSTNGIRLNGVRQLHIVLTPGVILKVGNTDCQVEGHSDASIDVPPPTWAEFFSDFSVQAKSKVQSKITPLHPFKPLLTLTAVSGLYAGKAWPLGYGPRAIGSHSLDVQILDPDLPAIAFVVSPHNHQAKFETDHPDKVRLNGQSKSAEILKDGDLIQFENTVLQVSFKE